MSQFLTVIETQIVAPVVMFNVDASLLVKSSRIIQPPSDQHRRYWIGQSGNPQATRDGFARTFPFAPFHVLHSVRAENRSELLERVIRMKFQQAYKNSINGWYDLFVDDLIWLRSITDDNYAQMIPQIENDLAGIDQARDVTPRPAKRRCAGVIIVDEKPPEDIEAMKQALLDQIKGLL